MVLLTVSQYIKLYPLYRYIYHVFLPIRSPMSVKLHKPLRKPPAASSQNKERPISEFLSKIFRNSIRSYE